MNDDRCRITLFFNCILPVMSEFSCSTTHGASQHDNPVPVTMATMGTTSVLSALSDDARPCIERLLMAEDEVDLCVCTFTEGAPE